MKQETQFKFSVPLYTGLRVWEDQTAINTRICIKKITQTSKSRKINQERLEMQSESSSPVHVRILSIQEEGEVSKTESASQPAARYTVWCWKSLVPYCRSDARFPAPRPHMLEVQCPSETSRLKTERRERSQAEVVQPGDWKWANTSGCRERRFPQSSWERSRVGEVSPLFFLLVWDINCFVCILNNKCSHRGTELPTSCYVKSKHQLCSLFLSRLPDVLHPCSERWWGGLDVLGEVWAAWTAVLNSE